MKRLVVIVALLLLPAIAHAQTLVSGAQFINDPCFTLQHLSAPIVQATATQKLIAGVASKQIFICGYHFSLQGTSPSVTLSVGAVVAATPCATTTASQINLTVEGGPGAGSLAGAGNAFDSSNGNGLTTVLGPAPPVATATALVYDVCSLTTTGLINGVAGYVDYVIK